MVQQFHSLTQCKKIEYSDWNALRHFKRVWCNLLNQKNFIIFFLCFFISNAPCDIYNLIEHCLFPFTYAHVWPFVLYISPATSLSFTIASSSFSFSCEECDCTRLHKCECRRFLPNLGYHSQQMESFIVHTNIFSIDFSIYFRLKVWNSMNNGISFLLTSNYTYTHTTHTVLLKFSSVNG